MAEQLEQLEQLQRNTQIPGVQTLVVVDDARTGQEAEKLKLKMRAIQQIVAAMGREESKISMREVADADRDIG